MKKQVYDIDKEGFIIEIYVSNIGENGEIEDEDKKNMVSEQPNDGILKPQWDGLRWMEGASVKELEEREKLNKEIMKKPSEEELKDARMELKILNTMIELGVI